MLKRNLGHRVAKVLRQVGITAAVVASVLALSSCASIPNSGLGKHELTGISAESRGTQSAAEDRERRGFYEAHYPLAGPFETGKWSFVRGIRFSEAELQSEQFTRILGADVRRYLNTLAPELPSFEGDNALTTGFMKGAGGTRLYQFVTLRLDWTAERSIVLNSASSGNSFKLSHLRMRVYGAKLSLVDSFHADRASAARLAEKADTDSLFMSWQIKVTRPNQAGGQTDVGVFPAEPFIRGGIWPFQTSIAGNELKPAFDESFEFQSDWMANDPSADHNVIVSVREHRGRFRVRRD